MTQHFLYLILSSVRNRVRQQVQRLRKPRYAAAAIVGFAYFFLVFGGWMPREEAGETMAGPWLAAGRAVGPLLLALFAAWWWLWGGYQKGLALSPAETHLLVPAPITRRQLILYKILSVQPSVLLSALFATLIMRGAGLPWPMRFVSVWVMLATLHQHQIAASLVHAAAAQQGRSGVRRHLVPIILFTVAFVVLLTATVRAALDIRAAGSLEFAAQRLGGLLAEPGPRLVLTPFRVVLDPTLAPDAGVWLPRFLIALALLALHYLWVQRTDAAFEETAAAEGERVHERMTALRAGGITRLQFTRGDRPKKLARPWLPLPSAGLPALAVTWKNVLYVQRSMPVVRLLLGLSVIFVVIVMLTSGERAETAGELGLMLLAWGGMITVAGPLAFRHDLRTDLAYLDQLRTYPLSGAHLVGAEIAGSTVSVTSAQAALVLPALVLLTWSGWVPPWAGVLLCISAAVVLPIINALSVTIQNAIALLLPGWAQIGANSSGGMEAIGQNMLTLLGTALLLLLSAIPPVIVGAAVGAPLAMEIGMYALVPAAAAAVATVAGEVFLAVRWLGHLYDTTDPVAAGLLR